MCLRSKIGLNNYNRGQGPHAKCIHCREGLGTASKSACLWISEKLKNNVLASRKISPIYLALFNSQCCIIILCPPYPKRERFLSTHHNVCDAIFPFGILSLRTLLLPTYCITCERKSSNQGNILNKSIMCKIMNLYS